MKVEPGLVADRGDATDVAATLAGDDRLPRPERLLQRFAEAGISSTPFAYAIDPTGETTLPLIEADPHAGDARPVMTDTDWVALQGICDG